MEWTVHQQIVFLSQSFCVGLLQGVMFDIFTGAGRALSRTHRLWIDIAYGPLSALLLFLGGLVIMDGQLHPLLLIGSFFGLWLEHMTIGTLLSRGIAAVFRLLRWGRSLAANVCHSLAAVIQEKASKISIFVVKIRKKRKNAKKIAK